MEMVVDVIYGKRLGNSLYHINTEYLKRDKIETDNKKVKEFINKQIESIQNSANIPDDVNVLLNNLKTELSLEESDLKKVNNLFALISYLGYELWFVFRNDIENATNMESVNRVYAMNKHLFKADLVGINHIQFGITNIFDNMSDLNLTSMVMSFLEEGKIKVVGSELTDLEEQIKQYRLLSGTKESNLMDANKVLHLLEQLDYHFIISMNSVPDEE